jgi:hypothetical protein
MMYWDETDPRRDLMKGAAVAKPSTYGIIAAYLKFLVSLVKIYKKD